MSLVKTWYTPEEAIAKYGVTMAQLMEWVEEGLVRSETEANQVVRVNVDDLKLELENLVQRG